MTETPENRPLSGSEPHAAGPADHGPPDVTWRGVVFNWLLIFIGGGMIALGATLLPDLFGGQP